MKIKLSDVKKAEREYAESQRVWGDNNMVTQRAEIKWRNLLDRWNVQKKLHGSKTNPRKRARKITARKSVSRLHSAAEMRKRKNNPSIQEVNAQTPKYVIGHFYEPIPFYDGKVLKYQGMATKENRVWMMKRPGMVMLKKYKGGRITAKGHRLFTSTILRKNPIRHGYTILGNGAELATFKTRHHAMQYGRAFANAHRTVRVEMKH